MDSVVEAPEPAAYKVEIILKGDHPSGVAKITAGEARLSLDIAANKQRGHTANAWQSGQFKLSVDIDFDGNRRPYQVILTHK